MDLPAALNLYYKRIVAYTEIISCSSSLILEMRIVMKVLPIMEHQALVAASFCRKKMSVVRIIHGVFACAYSLS